MGRTGTRLLFRYLLPSLAAVIVTYLLYFVFVPAAAAAEPSGSYDRLCTRCHAPAELARAHQGEKTGYCLECHAPHSLAYPPFLKVPPKDRCRACHFEYGEEWLKDAKRQGSTVHAPVQAGNCTDCHQEHELGNRPPLRVEKQFLCFSCHPDVKGETARPNQHPPYREGFCTDCHNPHLSPSPKLLQAEERSLCFNCHFAFSQVTALPVQHLPFARGLCTSCHEPHSSSYAALTKIGEQQLCYSCHFDRNADLAKPVKHPPYAEGRCTDCHNPHAAPTARLLRAASTQDLCFTCHSQSYVTGSSHHPVSSGIACVACHAPHAGMERALLPAASPTFCVDCHLFGKGSSAMAMKYYLASAHGRMDGGSCLNCHGGAGRPFRFATAEEKLRVCLSCHQDISGMVISAPASGRRGSRLLYTHPVGRGYTDPLTGGMLTCSSTCHDPHGTPYKKMLTRRGDALCLTCHPK